MSSGEVRITDPRVVTGTWSERVRAYVALAKPRIANVVTILVVDGLIGAVGPHIEDRAPGCIHRDFDVGVFIQIQSVVIRVVDHAQLTGHFQLGAIGAAQIER